MQLSFGEQVKIVLKRQGITIKELASIIEQQTGKKMSRQNLTQRLGRDNFQEKDMFMIAEALGCSLTINLLDAEEPAVIREAPAPAAAPEPVVEEKRHPSRLRKRRHLPRSRPQNLSKRLNRLQQPLKKAHPSRRSPSRHRSLNRAKRMSSSKKS